VAVTVRCSDNIFLNPIPAEYLETLTSGPAVEVYTNGIKAACRRENASSSVFFSNCTFRYSLAATPVVRMRVSEHQRFKNACNTMDTKILHNLVLYQLIYLSHLIWFFTK
jgi:hypothetical protein